MSEVFMALKSLRAIIGAFLLVQGLGAYFFYRNFAASSVELDVAVSAKRIANPLRSHDGRTWESISATTAILVKTVRADCRGACHARKGADVIEERLPLLRAAWLDRVPPENVLILSDQDVVSHGAVGLDTVLREFGASFGRKERYELADMEARRRVGARRLLEVTQNRTSMGWRVDQLKFIPGIHALHVRWPNMRWYVVVDDDTYLFLDNLALLLTRPEFSSAAEPLYMGRAVGGMQSCDKNATDRWFVHGGAGIVLNAPAITAIHEKMPACLDYASICHSGDLALGLCFRDADVATTWLFHMIGDSPQRIFSEGRAFDIEVGRPHDRPLSLHHNDAADFAIIRTAEHSSGGRPVTFGALASAVWNHTGDERALDFSRGSLASGNGWPLVLGGVCVKHSDGPVIWKRPPPPPSPTSFFGVEGEKRTFDN